jgi:hypothetical protein
MRSTHVGSCEIDGETLILPRFKTYSYALLIAPAWTAARYLAGRGPAVFAICLVVLSISDAAPVVWFLHALGLSIAPGPRGGGTCPWHRRRSSGLRWLSL